MTVILLLFIYMWPRTDVDLHNDSLSCINLVLDSLRTEKDLNNVEYTLQKGFKDVTGLRRYHWSSFS